MSVKDIFRKHWVAHIGDRKGEKTEVLLRPYLKNGAFRVAKSGTGNTVEAEIECRNLDEVAEYVGKGGFLIRMRSENPRFEGLYNCDGVEVVR